MRHHLEVHEYLGNMTFETDLGIESRELSFSLIIAPNADLEIIEYAAKALANLIVKETIDQTVSSQYHRN